MSTEPGLRGLLKRIRYDTTAIQAKITDALAMLDALGVDDNHPLKPRPNMPPRPEKAADVVAAKIRNGVITDGFELKLELAHLDPIEWPALLALAEKIFARDEPEPITEEDAYESPPEPPRPLRPEYEDGADP